MPFEGTNFQCFATTGDGSIVFGSLDDNIRLYSSSSMRQAKTVFSGLSSSITHVDVTYNGKWILGTTDTYLILICTLFVDNNGSTKTNFVSCMGNKILAPRLLNLNLLDSHMAGSNRFRSAQFLWCFATTGDGSIVFGSLDDNIRLYSSSSMRQAKTVFSGLSSSITHVDVTYNGKWILGTTDTYLILICTLFVDNNGSTKTNFVSCMGNKILAPRLLNLNLLDSHMAGSNRFRSAQFLWV
ncbi:Protein CYPRO4 [Capsicum chinense]|nr:Protein CYPRO4 [Capsicum chinense]